MCLHGFRVPPLCRAVFVNAVCAIANARQNGEARERGGMHGKLPQAYFECLFHFARALEFFLTKNEVVAWAVAVHAPGLQSMRCPHIRLFAHVVTVDVHAAMPRDCVAHISFAQKWQWCVSTDDIRRCAAHTSAPWCAALHT